ncbi:HNH endonuclease [Thioclava sp. GXIMD4215]|uniref:HNH endonuclease n=1 Tax=Thioclava sp. GXIMD4215 TaxID=3131928 RepID=UPI003244A70F
MIEADPSAMQVFERWKNAPTNAFGSKNNAGIIPDEDKAKYSLIYDELMSAAHAAQNSLQNPNVVEIKSMNYSRQYGSRGHRPVDVWVAICGAGSEAFGRMPQIYIIASDRGLEIGFAISINENDYHDPLVKARNRTIVPSINQKLPSLVDPLTVALSDELQDEGGWHFNSKARLSRGEQGYDEWSSFEQFIHSVKTSGTDAGGGSVCKLYQNDELISLDLEAEFSRVVNLFLPVVLRCLPNSWDVELTEMQAELETHSTDVVFNPSDIVDARSKVLRAIAERRGQRKFRQALLKAYNGACAISRIPVEAVLEAAHITPYLGDDTNEISNGLLLRADLHTLFDLYLIKINPETYRVEVSPSLASTPYWNYNDLEIQLPKRVSDRPSVLALAQHYGS